MKIKGWKKEDTSGHYWGVTLMAWSSEKGNGFIGIADPKDRKGVYSVEFVPADDPSKEFLIGKSFTKKEAIEIATNYMRSHPNG